MRAGQPHPEIATEAALRKTLLAARSVAYSRLGASGVYFAQLVVRMGIADEINAKATIVEQGFTAERLITGEADLAVQQISELKQVDGIEVIGAVPHELQTPAVFSAGRMADAEQAEAAEALLRYLASPEVVPVLRHSGLEPQNAAPASLRPALRGFEKDLSGHGSLESSQAGGATMIRKLASGEYRLYSRKVNPKTGKRRNLGTFKSRAAAEKHERDVQYFKRH